MNTPNWQTVNRMPADAPSADNQAAYTVPQLLCGSSADARFVYDAVYLADEKQFVLTLMAVNEAFGFIEHEAVRRFACREALLTAVAAFQAAPEAAFE